MRYCVPHKLALTEQADEVKFFFRVDNIYKNVKLELRAGETVLKSVSKRSVAPGEMESLTLNAAEVRALYDSGVKELEVTMIKKEASAK